MGGLTGNDGKRGKSRDGIIYITSYARGATTSVVREVSCRYVF